MIVTVCCQIYAKAEGISSKLWDQVCGSVITDSAGLLQAQHLQLQPGRRLPPHSIHPCTPQPLCTVGSVASGSETDETLQVLARKAKKRMRKHHSMQRIDCENERAAKSAATYP